MAMSLFDPGVPPAQEWEPVDLSAVSGMPIEQAEELFERWTEEEWIEFCEAWERRVYG